MTNQTNKRTSNIEEIPDYLRPPFGELDTVPEEDGLELSAAEAAPIPVDTKLVLPAPGLYGYSRESARFGITQGIAAIVEVGRIWEERQIASRIGVGDISKNGGGRLSGHDSHRNGLDFDLRPCRNDGVEDRVTISDPFYSRKLTQELVDLLDANSELSLTKIFFNDSQVLGVRTLRGHHNHLHVRFAAQTSKTGSPVLVHGNRRPAVREVQKRLNFWSTAGGVQIDRVEEDADFGDRTRDAVFVLQEISGLAKDGKVGANTWAALPFAPVSSPVTSTS